MFMHLCVHELCVKRVGKAAGERRENFCGSTDMNSLLPASNLFRHVIFISSENKNIHIVRFRIFPFVK